MTSPTDGPPSPSSAGRWTGELTTPVDADVLVPLRTGFGLAMLWALIEKAQHLREDFVHAPFRFTYHGFEWIGPLPESWMFSLYGLLAVCSILVTLGLLTRVAAGVFGVGFGYVFLLDRANYLNHDYLSCLLALVLVVVPSGGPWSLDRRLRPGTTRETIPFWVLWFARFHVALPYVFGGIAKLRADWLRGQPMRTWIEEGPLPLLVGPAVTQPWVAIAASWAGMLFDLSIVPMLLWHRTRRIGLLLMLAFHLLNALMFDIGVFPWLMIPATLVFLPPGWLRELLGDENRHAATTEPTRPIPALWWLLVAYASLHLVAPFRWAALPGNPSWTEEGNTFAWHMMLRHKVVGLGMTAFDPTTGRTGSVKPERWLTPKQLLEMGQSPEMLREFAQFIREQFDETGHPGVQVRAVVLCSLNGRKPQLLVDPTVDLAAEPRRWGRAHFVVPLVEPFRWEPWDVPLSAWTRHVEIPNDE